jgi:hypothetical protein
MQTQEVDSAMLACHPVQKSRNAAQKIVGFYGFGRA